MTRKNTFTVIGAAIFLLLVTLSCEVGLGTSIDTTAPTLTVSYPPAESIIRNKFIMAGTAKDETALKEVSVVFKNNTSKKETKIPTPATINSTDHTWTLTVNTPNADGSYPLCDGSYEVITTATDSAGRTSTVKHFLKIDNTAPLLVLTRPSTKKESTADAYGTELNVTGQAADANNIEKLTVDVYNKDTNKKMTSASQNNVPPTIDLTVAKYFENSDALSAEDQTLYDNYCAIYGSVNASGPKETKSFYCAITACDEALEFTNPASGTGTGSGNTCTGYYLYNDIYTGYLDTYKTTDLYAMLAGTQSVPATLSLANLQSQMVKVVTTAEDLLSDASTVGSFSLNPDNSPSWELSGYSPIKEKGVPITDAEAKNKFVKVDKYNEAYQIQNGAKITLKATAGLDKTPIEPDSLKVSVYQLVYTLNSGLVLYDEEKSEFKKVEVDDGNPIVLLNDAGALSDDSTALAARNAQVKVNGEYSYEIALTLSRDTFSNLKLGSNYLIVVDGKDKDGNKIDNDNNNVYVFNFLGSGQAPIIEITEPEGLSNYSRIYWNGKDSSEFYIKGLVYDADGSKLTIGASTLDGTVNARTDELDGDSKYPWTVTITKGVFSEGGLQSNELELTISAGVTSKILTLFYDIDAPTVAIQNPDSAVPPTGEDSLSVTTYRFSGSAEDALTGVNDVEYTILPKDELIDDDTEWYKALGSTSWKIPATLAESAGINTLKDIEIATDTITLHEGLYTLHVRAHDKATEDPACRNESNVESITFYVDKAKPGIQRKYISADELKSGTFGTTAVDMAQAFKLEGTASDATGVQSIKITRTIKDSKNDDATIIGTEEIFSETYATLPQSQPYEVNGFKDLDSPTQGMYIYTYTVTDGAGREATAEASVTYDVEAPVVRITTPANDDTWTLASNATISGTATDFSSVKSVWYTTDADKATAVATTLTSAGGDGWTKANGTTNWFFPVNNLREGKAVKTVYVVAFDNAGNAPTACKSVILNIDTSAPTITVNTVNGSAVGGDTVEVNNSTVSIIGTVRDSGIGIDVNSSTVTTSAGTLTFSGDTWTLTDTVSGSKTYTITAVDKADRSASKVLTVNYDGTKPTVEITSPTGTPTGENALTSKDYTFRGKCTDGGSYSSGLKGVYVAIVPQGSAAPVVESSDWKAATGTDTWTYSPVLEEGKYTIHVKGSDNSNNESDIVSRDFDIDVAAPVITVTSPVNAIETATYTVAGTITETNGVDTLTITRNGGAVTGVTIPSDKKSFSLSETPASDGVYTYVITATDTVGKTTQKTVTVTYDTTAPTLSVTTPSVDSSYSVSTSVTFKGTASDTASGVKAVKYSTDSTTYDTGTWTDVTGTTNWLVSCDLEEGVCTVSFIAIDEADYASAVVSKTVTVDLTAPVLVVTNPTQTVTSLPFTISGTVAETYLDTVKYKLGASGTESDVTLAQPDWSVEISSLTEGTYTYYITAKDLAGLSAQQTATVIYDKTAPTIDTVTLTPSGTSANGWYNNGTVTVSVPVTDTVSGISAVYYAVYNGDSLLADADKDAQFATWETNGDWKVLSGTSGTYSKSVPLDDGAGYIYIKAVDEAGNISYGVSPLYKIDTADPTGSIAVTYSGSDDLVTLTNCAKDLVVSGTATDSGSGVARVDIQINGANFTGNTATVTGGIYTCKIQPSVLESYCLAGEDGKSIAIKANIVDKANRSFSTTAQTVSLDRKKPTVVFTQPVKDTINGKITVSGTSSDNNNVTSLVVKKSVAGGTPEEITTTGSNYAWSYIYDSSADDGKVVSFTAVATDAAGNASATAIKDITVDQDSDRPEITFTQIDLDGMTETNPAWTTSRTIYGTAEDDDGVLTSLTINASKYNGSGWNAFAAVTNNGTVSSWNVTLPEDGKYRLQFVAKDSAGKDFTASDAEAYSLVTPKLKGGSGTIGYSNSVVKATYAYVVVDTESSSLKYKSYELSADGVTWDPSSTDSLVGKTFGGTKKYLRIKMTASDTNGMATTDAVKATLSKQEDSTTVSFTNTTGTDFYESDSIDVSGKDGYYTLKVTATDKAGAKTEETYQFLLDNTAPSITLTSHTNNQQVGGHSSVVLRGITDDAKTINYDFVKNPDDSFSGTQLAGSPLSWKLAFDGDSVADETHAGLLNTYLYSKATDTEKTDIWGSGGATGTTYTGDPIPVYVRLQVIDALGNKNDPQEVYTLLVDPAGNRPSVTIEYPTDGATVSGTVRMYGSATDNSAINGVYVQYGTSATNWKTASGDIDGYVAISGTSMYGFKASGNNSWGYAINTRNLPAGFGSSLWVRVYSVDDSSPSPAVSSPIVMSFTVDNAAPRIGDSKDLYLEQYAGDGTTVVASRKYEEGMWIQGEWYLSGSVEDENGIASVTLDGTPLVVGTSIIEDYSASLVPLGRTDVTNYRLKVKVGALTGCGNTSFELEATDNDSSGGRATSRTISINYDNTAPVLSQNATDGYTVKGEILNSNGFYQLGGVVNEDTVQDPSTGAYCSQSGFKYLAFYFLRRNSDKSGVVYDPMLLKSHTVNNVATGSLEYQNGLWWKKVTGVTATEGSSSITVTTDSNMHRGGLVMIDGSMYKITEDPTTTTVALDGQPAAGTGKTAYFAMALIADNLSAETATGTIGANGYYATADIRNDDGDGIVEYVERSGTKYSWFANVNSANIMDGDIEVHYVAFDAAGNYSIGVTGYEADRAAYIGKITDAELTDCDTSGRLLATNYHADSAFIQNNQPRLAGVRFGTDNDGNGVVDDNEYVSGWTALMADYDYNVTGMAQENSATETDATKISKVGYNASRAKVTEIVAGNATTPVITAKGVTKIIPTIIGGTDNLSYTYSITKSGADTTYVAPGSTTSFVTGLANDGVDVSQTAIELMTELIGDAHTTNASGTAPSKFDFTIWTQTGGKTIGTNSQYAKITAYMNVMLGDIAAPVAKITPFYWKSATENSLYGNSRDNGHIELEADLPTEGTYVFTAGGTGLMDRDPKVSGKITYRGTVTDNALVEKLCMRIATSGTDKFTFAGMTQKSGNYYVLATYDPSTTVWKNGAGAVLTPTGATYTTGNFATDGWAVRFTPSISDAGHSISWEFDLDTSEVVGIACLDAALEVFAMDKGKITAATKDGSGKWTYTYGSANSSTPGTTQTVAGAETGYYKVDVVPYITRVKTGLSSEKISNPSVYNRTALGHYPVQSVVSNVENGKMNNTTSESITLSGFNLNGDTVTVTGITTVDTATVGQISFNVAELKSGKPKITVQGIEVMNNLNDNEAKGVATSEGTAYANWYNRQANGDNNNILTDDIEFDVWEFNDRAAVPLNGLVTGVQMQINQQTKMLNYAFTNGALFYSMAGKVGVTNYSSYYWAGDWDVFTGACVGFHVDDLGYTYSSCSGGDTNNSGDVDTYAMWSSRWGVGEHGTGGTYLGKNAVRLEKIALKTGDGTYDYDLNKNRCLSPEYASSVNGNATNLYHVYYDAICDEIRFRAGTLNTTAKQSNRGFTDEYTGNPSSYYGIANCQVIANGTSGKYQPSIANRGAGNYVDIAVAKNGTTDVVCVVWFDAYTNSLKYSYIVNPIGTWNTLKNTATAANWSPVQTIFAEGGEYCKLAVDKNNHIHIAAYAGNGDVKYAYLDKYSSDYSEATNSCIVDASGSVGEHLTLDVALDSDGNSIPYIGYYTSAIKMPKCAYLVNTEDTSHVPAGADENERFTGNWEVATIPTVNRITSNREDKINIGLWKDAGVITDSKIGGATPNSTYTSTLNGYNSTSTSQTYGNGSSNAVLAYQIANGSGSCIETAQMREK